MDDVLITISPFSPAHVLLAVSAHIERIFRQPLVPCLRNWLKTDAGPSTHHPHAPPRKTLGALFAPDDTWRLGCVVPYRRTILPMELPPISQHSKRGCGRGRPHHSRSGDRRYKMRRRLEEPDWFISGRNLPRRVGLLRMTILLFIKYLRDKCMWIRPNVLRRDFG